VGLYGLEFLNEFIYYFKKTAKLEFGTIVLDMYRAVVNLILLYILGFETSPF